MSVPRSCHRTHDAVPAKGLSTLPGTQEGLNKRASIVSGFLHRKAARASFLDICNLNIQPAHPKGNQSWIFIGRTDTEAETPILWPPDAKNRLIGKNPDDGKDWRWEKGTTEDEMAGWHHRLNRHEFEWALGVGYGQGGLVFCSPWDCKESDTTERLNWNLNSHKGLLSEDSTIGLMLCCYYLEILSNISTRDPTFSFCTELHKL